MAVTATVVGGFQQTWLTLVTGESISLEEAEEFPGKLALSVTYTKA